MRDCEDCAHELREVEEEPTGTFPVLTVIGGVLGGAAAAFTGSLVLVPVGTILGLGGDVAVCEVCGSEEDVHEIMEQRNSEDEVRFQPHEPCEFRVDEMPGLDTGSYSFDQDRGAFVPMAETGADNSGQTFSGFDWSVSPALDVGNTGGQSPGTSSTGAASPGGEASGGGAAGGSGVGGFGGGGE